MPLPPIPILERDGTMDPVQLCDQDPVTRKDIEVVNLTQIEDTDDDHDGVHRSDHDSDAPELCDRDSDDEVADSSLHHVDQWLLNLRGVQLKMLLFDENTESASI